MKHIIDLATQRFKLDINGTHGLAHWQRVESRGLEIAKRTNANITVVRHFAYLHDACREGEWDDNEHGHRSADWCQTLWGDGHLDLPGSTVKCPNLPQSPMKSRLKRVEDHIW